MKEITAAIELLCAHAGITFLAVEAGVIRFASEGAARVFGMYGTSLEGLPVSELIPEFDRLREEFERSALHPEAAGRIDSPIYHHYFTRVDGDGAKQHFDISLRRFGQGGEERILVALTKGLTETGDGADTKDQLITRLLGVAHDMRCHANGMQAAAALMRLHLEPASEPVSVCLDIVTRGSRLCDGIVHDMIGAYRSYHRLPLQGDPSMPTGGSDEA